MGNDVDATFRGEGDIPLTDLLSHLKEEEFEQFLKDASEAGALDPSEFPNKQALIARLPDIEFELKENILKNLKEGKKPFENREIA